MDEPLRELVRDWLTRASHDLRSAEALARLEDPLLDTPIYHCQQAAEKSVKAWLQSRDDPFPKTHDIEDLVNRASGINRTLQDFRRLPRSLRRMCGRFGIPAVWKAACRLARNSMRLCNMHGAFTTSF